MELTDIKRSMVDEYNSYFGFEGKEGERRRAEEDTGDSKQISTLALYKYFQSSYKDCKFYKKLNDVLKLKRAAERAAGFAKLLNNKRFYFGFLNSDTYRSDLKNYCKALDLKKHFSDGNIVALFENKDAFEKIAKSAEEAVIIMLMSYFVMNFKDDGKAEKSSVKSFDYKLRQIQDSGLCHAFQGSGPDTFDWNEAEEIRKLLMELYKSSKNSEYEDVYVKLRSDPYTMTTLLIGGTGFLDYPPEETFNYMVQEFDMGTKAMIPFDEDCTFADQAQALFYYRDVISYARSEIPDIIPETGNQHLSKWRTAIKEAHNEGSLTTEADARKQQESQEQDIKKDRKNGSWESSRVTGN